MTVYAITLGFANPLIIKDSIDKYYETATRRDVVHAIVDNHYPIPDVPTCTQNIMELCQKYKIRYLDGRGNLGLQGGFNFGLKQLGVKSGDYVIGYDPDVCPETVGWDDALIRTLDCDETIVWGSLNNLISSGEMNERELAKKKPLQLYVEGAKKCGGELDLYLACKLVVRWRARGWSQILWGLECKMWPRLDQKTKRWVFINEFCEKRLAGLETSVDRVYTIYKWLYAHEKKTTLDFEAFLKYEWPSLKENYK